MKRAIRIASTVGIMAGVVLLTVVLNSNNSRSADRVSARLFRTFPVGHTKRVEFAWGGGALRHLSQREERDQSLDWLLLGLLSDSGISKEELNKLVFDLPPVRAGYFHSIGMFEYGDSRSRYMGNGRVLALVPQESEQDRALTLARIADEQRKNTGKIPAILMVFEFTASPDHQTAQLVRRPDVEGPSLYTEAAGYREAKIEGRAELQDFLNATSDLTYAKLDGGTLVLGGRSLPNQFRKITLDDVAALWQSEQTVKANKKEIDDFEAKWQNATYRTQAEKQELTRQYEKEAAELKARLSAGRAATSSGFSLDPTFDYQGFNQVVDRLSFLLGKFATPENMAKIKVGLQNRDEGPLFEVLEEMDKSGSPLTELFEQVTDAYKFQAARYDGDLRGTEVGMTLFYTDLLAKLKALDYWNQSPVPDFVPMTKVHLSPVYDKEFEVLRNTRLWFGPLDQGYQNAGDSLLFTRNSTRIYAASSNPYTPGKEVEPNAQSASFLGWWNDHYEEVAAYEPEYGRLNEIMKWSLLVSWLNQSGSTAPLMGLQEVNVNHSDWFPDWVHHHPELRYSNWSRVKFYPRGYKGAKTEAMPMLASDRFDGMGKIHFLMGGVSLASEDAIRARAALPKVVEGTEELGLRSGVDYASFESNGQRMLKTLDQTEHVFAEQADGVVSTVSKARPAAKFRGADTEIANLQVERTYVQAGSDLKIDVKIGGTQFGEFSSLSSGEELRIGFHELEMDRAHDLAEEASAAMARHMAPGDVLAQNADVQYLVGMDCDGCYAIKMRGSARWLKLAKDTDPSVNLKEGWQARVAALDDEKSPTINLAFVDADKFQQELQSTRYLHLASDPEQRTGVTMTLSNRGPPAGSTPVEVEIAGAKVSGTRGPDGVIYVERDRLPDTLGHNPENLIAAMERDKTDPLVDRIRSNDYRRAADEIAADPVTAKKTIDAAATRALSEADRALAAGDDGAAIRQIDTAIQLRGSSPDLLARRAVAQVRSDPEQAVESIRQALNSHAESPESIFRAVNARLSRGDLGATDADNLQKIAIMLDLRSYEQSTKLGDQIIPFFRNGHIDFRVRLMEEVRAEPFTGAMGKTPDGAHYVLDNPGLHNNDPVVGVHTPIDPTVAREFGKTVKLPRFDLAWAKPQVIETADGKQWVRLDDANSLHAHLHVPTSFTPMSSQANCSGQVDGQCQSYAYLSEPAMMSSAN